MWGQPPSLPCFAEAPSEAEGEAEGAVQRAKRATFRSRTHPPVMLSAVGSSKGRFHAVEAPHTRRHHPKPKQAFPPRTQTVQPRRLSS